MGTAVSERGAAFSCALNPKLMKANDFLMYILMEIHIRGIPETFASVTSSMPDFNITEQNCTFRVPLTLARDVH
jgi:hypothetical protein